MQRLRCLPLVAMGLNFIGLIRCERLCWLGSCRDSHSSVDAAHHAADESRGHHGNPGEWAGYQCPWMDNDRGDLFRFGVSCRALGQALNKGISEAEYISAEPDDHLTSSVSR